MASRTSSQQPLGPTGLTNSAAEDAAVELERELEAKKLAVVKMKADIRARLEEQRKVDDDLVGQLQKGVEEEKKQSALAVQEARSAEVAQIRRIHDEMDELQDQINRLNADEELAAAALLRLTSTLSDSQQSEQQPLKAIHEVFEDMCDLLEGAHHSIGRLRAHLRQEDDEPWTRPRLPPASALKEDWTHIQREMCPASISVDHGAGKSLQLLRRFVTDIKHEYALFTAVFKGEMSLQTKLHDELEAQKDVLIAAQMAVKNTSDDLHETEMELRGKESVVKQLTDDLSSLDTSDLSKKRQQVDESLRTSSERIAEIERDIESLTMQKDELAVSAQKAKQGEIFAKDEADHIGSKRQKLKIRLEALENERLEVAQKVRTTSDNRDTLSASRPQLTRDIGAAEQEVAAAALALKTLEERIVDLTSDKKLAEQGYSAKAGMLKEREIHLETLRASCKSLKEKQMTSEDERHTMAEKVREQETKLLQKKRHNAELMKELQYVRTLLPDTVVESSPLRTRCSPAEYLELIGSSPEVIRQDVANRRSDILSRVMEPGFLSPEPPHNRGESNLRSFPNPSVQRVGSMQSASSMGAQRPVLANTHKARQWGAPTANNTNNALYSHNPTDREGSTSTIMSGASIDRAPSSVAPVVAAVEVDPRPAVSHAAISSINKRLADILERKNKRDGGVGGV